MTGVRAAAIYTRISSDPTGAALGVARQEKACRELAERRGWPVAEVYQDNDLSAYSGKPRPAYERMVADIAAGTRDALVVYNLDRLTRQPRELEAFLDVCQAAGVSELGTVTADINIANDDGMFMARIFAAFAAKESGRRSARVRSKMQANAEAGLPHGGSFRPFGYAEDKITVREDEAVVVRELVARFLAGESLRSLATWLSDTGVATVSGKPWRTTSLRAMLTSARIAGLREHRGEVVGPAVWDPIVTADQHRRVRALMASNAATGRRSPRRYLLSGLLRCGKCGSTLYSSARANSRRYVCLKGPDHGGCGRLTVVAAPVERLMSSAVCRRLDGPEVLDSLAGRAAADEALSKVSGGLAEDQAQLQELASAYGEKQISLRDWLEAKKPIEARIEAAQRRIARSTRTDALQGLPGQGKALLDTWDTLSLTRQAAIVAAVLDHAVIGPGLPSARNVDPARVQPVWRL